MRKKKKSKVQDKSPISRFNPNPEVGLKQDQIKKRNEQGLVNISSAKTSKSIGGILVKNIFTFFNMICNCANKFRIYKGRCATAKVKGIKGHSFKFFSP